MSKKSNARLLNALKKRPFHDWNGHRYFTDGNICALDKNGQVVVRYTKGDTDWITARIALSEAAKKARETPVDVRAECMKPSTEKEIPPGITESRPISPARENLRDIGKKLAAKATSIAEPSTPPSPGG